MVIKNNQGQNYDSIFKKFHKNTNQKQYELVDDRN